ncbi:glycosyltransferase family 2 protein [Parvicella tangerina]|uniref:Undecaprenyl-phosphate 4-deoxy-4-formamido-L-arabinose transferase n=1 Tax=Parvicella tangerina TaxID=2829795 RepID=A0A916JN54_9FLAO|nr:glycosyltransferase family 2 protein [Parvicella tangerina]CAG5082708.1 Undecaprenyl-phosphate 4-deoxy-4-formamido-L-arabinose transferase [Parvicella tangerina]
MTNEQDKISIITPFYNAEAFLEECILSIQRQTFTSWELILVNDQSSDQSNEIALKFSRNDERIHLFQNVNKGLIQALRLAYKNSSGNYITRMDADDKMTSKRLELMLNELAKKGRGHVCVGKVKYYSEYELGDGYKMYEKWLNALTEQEANFEGIYRECSIPSPNFLIHRSDFESIGGFENDTYPEDYDLAFRMYKHKLQVCSVKEVTHHWRDHSTRSTRTQAHYQPIRFIPLKVKYFLEIDYDDKRQLVLWGAGKKGKLIAQELVKHQVDFKWVTDNEKKVGKDIYGVRLEVSHSIIDEQTHVILAVSNPQEIMAIEQTLKSQQSCSYWPFF